MRGGLIMSNAYNFMSKMPSLLPRLLHLHELELIEIIGL